MNTTFQTPMNRFRIIALAVGLGAAVALTGCSSDGAETSDDKGSQTTNEQEQGSKAEEEAPAAEEPADEEPADDAPAAGGSDLVITVGGEPLEVADPYIACEEMDGTLMIAIGSTTGADGIGATLTTGDNPTVKTVALGSLDGTAMAWAEGAPGEANATKDGSVYTISGSMSVVDMNNPTSMDETDFEMVIPCP